MADQSLQGSETIEVAVDRIVAGALGLAHASDGRVVLVEGALPGELVRAEVIETKPRLLRARMVEVVRPAGGRIEEPCPEVAAGCGGCDLQHATVSDQLSMKVSIVADALGRIGKIRGVPVLLGERLPSEGYRTTLRCGVGTDSSLQTTADRAGRLGFRRRHDHLIHTVETCMVAHPLAAEIIESGRFPGVEEAVIRVGARTGERLVVATPNAQDVEGLDDVQVVGADELDAGLSASYHEVIAGRRFQISARSFFQSRPDGAEALVRAVKRALGEFDPIHDRLVDLYGGVGLFTGVLDAKRSVLVEKSGSSSADARVNLTDLGTEVIRSKVERWRPSPADAVIADPARAGLGKDGVSAVMKTGADRVALISCDPASMARDSRLLVDGGYELSNVELVDMFPHTHHIESVATFRRVKTSP